MDLLEPVSVLAWVLVGGSEVKVELEVLGQMWL